MGSSPWYTTSESTRCEVFEMLGVGLLLAAGTSPNVGMSLAWACSRIWGCFLHRQKKFIRGNNSRRAGAGTANTRPLCAVQCGLPIYLYPFTSWSIIDKPCREDLACWLEYSVRKISRESDASARCKWATCKLSFRSFQKERIYSWLYAIDGDPGSRMACSFGSWR